MTEAMELVTRNFARDGDRLVVGGVPVDRIVAEYGTPLFVYDRALMEDRVDVLRAVLPPDFRIYYSIKANPSQAILRVFLERGCGLEVASSGELFLAVSAGCIPERIVFAGPGKTTAELRDAARIGVGELHVESFDEIRALGAIADELSLDVRVAIRVNPEGEVQGGAMRMGGKPSPFGIGEEDLDEALDLVLSCRRLQFSGIHLFIGTQILDHEILAAQYRRGVEISARASKRAGGPLRSVDFGGGLGIPYYPGDRALDVDGFGRLVRAMMEEVAGRTEFRGTRFLIEPGRYLVGESGVYLSRVTYVKRSRGKTFVVVDGGMHHHLAASGNLGQVIKRNFPIAVATRLGRSPDETVDVVGPLCTPLDVLARDVQLPAVDAGDIIAVFQSGAYARTASPLGFLSHPTPAEVMIAGGEPRVIRRRGDRGQLLADQ